MTAWAQALMNAPAVATFFNRRIIADALVEPISTEESHYRK